jgi:hypothetical protein
LGLWRLQVKTSQVLVSEIHNLVDKVIRIHNIIKKKLEETKTVKTGRQYNGQNREDGKTI